MICTAALPAGGAGGTDLCISIRLFSGKWAILMKEIFVFVGSRKGESSSTYQYTKMILDRVCTERPVKVTVAFADGIELCSKCSSCFGSGVCAINDRMNELKAKMLSADMIILASGVYFQQISAEMKNFIDRISYWAHTFELAGKRCIIVTTSGSNGNEIAESYLKRVAVSLGMQLIGTTCCHTMYPDELSAPELLTERTGIISGAVINALDGKTKPDSIPFQEQLFASMKKIYSEHEEFVHERRKWKQNGFFQAESFREIIDKRANA